MKRRERVMNDVEERDKARMRESEELRGRRLVGIDHDS